MSTNASAPATVGAVNRGRELDHADGLIGSHTKPNLHEQQAEHVRRRCRLAVHLARTVAELAWRAA